MADFVPTRRKHWYAGAKRTMRIGFRCSLQHPSRFQSHVKFNLNQRK